MIDLKPAYLKKVKGILSANVPEFDVLVYGSRARGGDKKQSYPGLGVRLGKKLAAARLDKLEAAFKGAGLPFRVETICWAATGSAYRKEMKKTGVLIHATKKK